MHDFLLYFISWFLGGLVNNLTGFGAALVAMPFIAISIPLDEAVPASTLIVLALNLHLGWRYRREIRWGRLRYLFMGGLGGTLAGAFMNQVAGSATLKVGMGVFLIAYAAYCLLTLNRSSRELASWWGIVAGFASTVLGALFGFNGPPLALYVANKGWSQKGAKSVLAACFIMTGIMIMSGQLATGVHNAKTLAGFLAGCPGALLGGMLGLYLSRYISQGGYRKSVLLLVLWAGMQTLISSV